MDMSTPSGPRQQINTGRRRFLATALAAAPLLYQPRKAIAAISDGLGEKHLRLFNPRTKELLETTFCSNGVYIPAALADISHLMRDLRNGETHTIDTKLIDLLHTIQEDLGLTSPFHVISAYRSQETNEHLRKQGWAAAKNSFHLHGQAVDIRHADVSTARLRKAAYQLKEGGVGYYPRLNFVHLDIGPVRFWRKG